MRPLIFLPALIFPLISCSSGKESFDELYKSKGRPPEVYRDREQQQNEEIYVVLGHTESTGSTHLNWNGLNQVLTLFNGTTDCPNCPLSSGYIITRDLLNRGRTPVLTDFCQGVLTDEDIFVTNRQCLPGDVSRSGDSCENEVQVVLPRINDNYPMEILRCDHLLLRTTEQATLKLKDRSTGRFSDNNNQD